MIFLYFILDVCIYNYTNFQTNILMLSFFEPKLKIPYFLTILFIDYLLLSKGKIFIIYSILYFINKKIKLNNFGNSNLFIKFIILNSIYICLTLILFQKAIFNIGGIIINFIILFICYKKI